MLIDTHTHLYLPEFQPESEQTVRRAIDAGVGMMVFPNVDLSTIGPMKSLARKFPDNIRMAMGLHPTEVNADWKDALHIVREELCAPDSSYIGVGEIGMDLYWDRTFEREQMLALEEQCQWALEKDLPVIIHNREALDPVLEVISSFGGRLRGVFHSFGGSRSDVERIKSSGDFYFGINGIVTFKNSSLRGVLPVIGIDRIVLETDSPYLAPVPKRGKRNESSYIIHVGAFVGQALGKSLDEIADITSANARKLFSLPVGGSIESV